MLRVYSLSVCVILMMCVVCIGDDGVFGNRDCSGSASMGEFVRSGSWCGVIKAHRLLIQARKYVPKGGLIQLNDFGSADIAYLSVPFEQPVGGLILIHEWWGLNDHIKRVADRFAGEGFVVVAVDLFNGRVANNIGEARRLMEGLNEKSAVEAVRAAERFLGESPRFRVPRTAVIGWCMGGGISLQSVIQIASLDAGVIYYGPLETDPALLRRIKAPVLAHFAKDDPWGSEESARIFIDRMREAGKEIEAHFYDAHYAFANPGNAKYDSRLAALAWERTLSFLREQFSRAKEASRPGAMIDPVSSNTAAYPRKSSKGHRP